MISSNTAFINIKLIKLYYYYLGPGKILLKINLLKNVIRLFQFFTNPVFSWKRVNIQIRPLNNTSKPDLWTSDKGTFDER